MKITAILNIIGHVMKYEIILLLIPFFVALFYGQGDANAFLYTVLLMIPIALILIKIKGKKNEIYAKEGFLTVGLAWIVISFFGALPFVFSGAIPSLVDAFFETSSGFTTTGASILTEIQSLPKGILFWRSFTHWIGGMGVLVFMLSILPLAGGNNMHILRAESPGPSVGKLVPRLRSTATILYAIY